MPRTHKVVTPKGSRYPGSGRVKGTPNKVSVEARQLVGELVTNAEYQQRLRRDFELRRVHPTIESMLWAYHIGKPKETVHLTATVDVNARLEEDRRIFAQLDIRDLEQLAAESQGLVDRAMALAKVRSGATEPQDVVVEQNAGNTGQELLGICSGSDNGTYVTHSEPSAPEPKTPEDTEG